ncbi:MAG TPA: hypothetical protein DCP28_13685 [Cytophagales bacterium]|nr:hypothetical protein [Cytophagales bacterium]
MKILSLIRERWPEAGKGFSLSQAPKWPARAVFHADEILTPSPCGSFPWVGEAVSKDYLATK